MTVADLGEIMEPYYVPAQLQLYVMFGSMMITRKLDMFNPVIVKVIRYVATFDKFAFFYCITV